MSAVLSGDAMAEITPPPSELDAVIAACFSAAQAASGAAEASARAAAAAMAAAHAAARIARQHRIDGMDPSICPICLNKIGGFCSPRLTCSLVPSTLDVTRPCSPLVTLAPLGLGRQRYCNKMPPMMAS